MYYSKYVGYIFAQIWYLKIKYVVFDYLPDEDKIPR